jgi:adenylate cyclase
MKVLFPTRVAEEINAEQHKSELLVASVQLVIVALFFIFYLIAPIDYPVDAPVHSAPLGLSLFTIVVLVRLWFAATKQLNSVLLGLLVILEMVVLLSTIWTYYLQFETMPTINLKNPHFVYVFILIALRALRFEPLWVIFSGLTAVIGWLIIIWHVLATAGARVITWDYVTYVSTRSVYPSAEFDKILAIVLVTTIISIVLYRARNTLARAVSQSHAVKDLATFFDPDVAKKITSSNEALKTGYGETRQAAIMFIDMRGFTKLSEQLSARELIALISEYQQLLGPILHQHGGNIDKYLGDGILASFGAVKQTQTFAADALRAVDQIMSAVVQWQSKREQAGLPKIAVGMAVVAGEIIFGVIGDVNRLEYTVIGETVNLASKLEKQNKVEGVNALTTEATLEIAQAQGYIPKQSISIRRQRLVAGVANPLDLAILG